jgi:hypothetical protein
MQELGFLSEIDPYRFRKFGRLPAIAHFLGLSESDLQSATPVQVQPAILNHLRDTSLLFEPNNDDWDGVMAGIAMPHVTTLYWCCAQPVGHVNFQSASALAESDDRLGGVLLSVAKALDRGLLVSEMNKASLEIAESVLHIAKEDSEKVLAEERDITALVPFE